MIFHAARKLNSRGIPELDNDIYIEQQNVEENKWVPGLNRCCNPRSALFPLQQVQIKSLLLLENQAFS